MSISLFHGLFSDDIREIIFPRGMCVKCVRFLFVALATANDFLNENISFRGSQERIILKTSLHLKSTPVSLTSLKPKSACNFS